METILINKELLTEEERLRKETNDEKSAHKIIVGRDTTDIEHGYIKVIKEYNEIKETEKINQVVFCITKGIALHLPKIKAVGIIEYPKKVELVIFEILSSTELKIPDIKCYHDIAWSSRIKTPVVREEFYSPKLIIPDLEEMVLMEYSSLIAYQKIVEPSLTKIKPPTITLKKINFQRTSPTSISKERALLQHTGTNTIENETLAASLESDEELPDFFEILFSGGVAGNINLGEPTVICLEELSNDSYIGSLQTICTRIYREKIGGMPKPTILSHLTEDFRSELTRWMKAENKIFSVQLDGKDWQELDDADWSHIYDRIEELFAQSFGFIIFNKSVLIFQDRHHINTINIKPKELDFELKRRISSVVWGFVNLEDANDIDFDHIFESARKKFKKTLENIQKEERGIYVDATNSHAGEESDLHSQMKWFLVKYLTMKLRNAGENLKTPTQIKNRIEVEKEYQVAGSKIIPDIKCNDSVYEVETLFAEDRDGKIPRNKIVHTFIKYENDTSVHKINVVFDNLTFIRHLRELRDIKHNHKDWQKKYGKKVEFYTLDLEKWDLISLDKMSREIKKMVT
jgi:hypothetical protein